MRSHLFDRLKHHWRQASVVSLPAAVPPIGCTCLEDRILYSAVPFDVPVEVGDWSDADIDSLSVDAILPQHETFDVADVGLQFPQFELLPDSDESNLFPIDSDSSESTSPVQHLVFINHDVADIDQLVASLKTGPIEHQVFILNDATDGIQQVTDILASLKNVASMHFVSHGADGQINLGNSALSMQNLNQYQSQLASWKTHLTVDADMLFYGCDVAATAAGQEFLETIALWTETDIAASNDQTGHESLGGNWVLEFNYGEVASSALVSADFQKTWIHALAVDVANGQPAIWISTIGNANVNSGVSWTDSQAVQIGAPNLQFEPGTSNGTFELTGFSSPVSVRGIHVVNSASILVGDTTLQQGDLLFAVNSTYNFGPFTADRHDIVLFRPTAANNYSAGTYSMFLDEGIHDSGSAYNVHALSLIEKNVTIGGHLLTAGTFVVAHSTPSDHDNLYTVNVNTTSYGGTGLTNTDNKQLFLLGSGAGTNLNFNDNQIQGIEVLEEAVTMGGTTIAQGSILLSLNLKDTTTLAVGGGASPPTINGEDIFYLTVTSTEFNGGTNATAKVLFEGNDVGLNSGAVTGATAENFNGLSLINSLAPAVTVIANNDSYTTNENTPLVVNGPGVWANDDSYAQNITTGVLLDYRGHVSATGTTWQDRTNVPGFDIAMSGTTQNSNATGQTPGIISTYAFNYSGSGVSSHSLDTLPGDPTNSASTIELWFRPTDDNGKEVLFETGGTGAGNSGLSLRLKNKTLEFLAYNTSFYVELNADLTAAIASGKFIQVAMTMNIIDADADLAVDDLALQLFVNGTLRDTRVLLNTTDWSQAPGETFALGNFAGTALFIDGGSWGLSGEIGAFRVYDSVLTGTALLNNYNAVASLQVVSNDSFTSKGIAITVNLNGSFTYSPGSTYDYLAVGQSTTDTFSYVVQDGFGNTDSATVTITINGVNDAPTSPTGISNVATDEDAPFTRNISGNFSDVDAGDILTYTALLSGNAPLPSWLSFNGTTGVFSGTPGNANVGSMTIVVTANDGNGGSRAESFLLTVNNVNDPPVVNNQSFSIDEGLSNGSTVGTIFATDPDAGPAGNLTFSLTGGTGATAFNVSSSGQITVADSSQLNYLAATSFTLNVLATDGGSPGLTDTATITINLNDVANILVVDTTSDVIDGNINSIGQLLANRGFDGRISLREAIEATNRTINSGGPDRILFAIPNSDLGHFYYRNDGIAGSLSLIATTTLADASITDFDPDYAYTAHSWFRINLNNALSQLTVSDSVWIDGYSQAGTSANTLSVGDNANLRIELTNLAADAKRGLTFATGSNGSILQGLAINRFGGLGVLVDYNVHNVTIQGNFIGTDITGTRDFGNGDSGIQLRSNNNLIGGPNAADRNVISGNDSRGVSLFSGGTLTGNVIQNNYIGVNATGLAGLGNDSYGVQLYNDNGTRIIDNVISGNQTSGIQFRSGGQTHNAVIQGNLIGVGADRASTLGNGADGIRVESTSATGNLIGGSGIGQGNIIGANGQDGITFTGAGVSGNFVYGNAIGTSENGLLDFGNFGSGLLIASGSFGNTIGGVAAGQANLIQFNNQNGVRVTGNSSDGNRIRGNVFKNNSNLAIDLVGSNGVNANDLLDIDNGANQGQNYPVLTSATVISGDLTITGTLNSTSFTTGIIIDFYWSTIGAASSHGEAANYINSIVVNTDALGNAIINSTFLAAGVPAGAIITATATDASGNTSEFALNVPVVSLGNAPPTDLSPNSFAINENTNTSGGYLLGTLVASDPDVGDTFTYSISGGSDSSRFSIGGAFGDQLIFDAGILNFEIKSSYTVEIQVQDSAGNIYVESLTVIVNDLNEAPTVNDQIFSINENSSNGTVVGNVVASDPDAGVNGSRTFTVIGGSGATAFSVNGLGQITIVDRSQLDFETNPTFTLDVRVTDGGSPGLTDLATITINLNDINDAPVVNDQIFSINENSNNGTVVGNIVSSDPDAAVNGNRTFTVIGGSGTTAFSVNSMGQIVVADRWQLDFETTSSFTLNVRVTDGGTPGLTDIATITINLNDVNEAPVITSFPTTIAENQTIAGYVTAFDQDYGPLAYSIMGGADAGRFAINTNTGQLVFLSAPDFELPGDADGNNQYQVQVRVTDALGMFDLRMLNISVTNVVEGPVTIAPPPASPPVVTIQDVKDADDDDKDDDLLAKIRAVNPVNRHDNPFVLIPATQINQNASSEILTSHSLDQNNAQTLEISASDAESFSNAIQQNRKQTVGNPVSLLNSADMGFVISPGWLWQDLDTLDQQMQADAQLGAFWTVAAPSITTTISVGYVMWLIKGGQIMAGLVAQVPAWKLIAIDPLPIIGAIDRKEDEQDRESLATMVDHASEADSDSNELNAEGERETAPDNLTPQPASPWDEN